MKTYTASAKAIRRDWYVIDASGKVLGRLATEIARRLRGKHKPTYTPHLDTGDYVVVINAAAVALTGNKEADKVYHRHTGRISGIRTRSARQLRAEAPGRLLEHAVRGMMPKGPLGRDMLSKLHVYPGAEHPHQAQQPKPLAI
jgi:large subunit ribosomal protein L13